MTPAGGVSRRHLLRTSGVLAAAGLVGLPEVAGAEPGTGVTIRSGTNMSAALSPDGATVAFDVLSTLWVMPIGGRARPLTGPDLEVTQPSWAPDGKSLVCQAYVDGNFHIYLVPVSGGLARRLTDGPFDHREPHFSPDGAKIAFVSDRTGRSTVLVLDLDTGILAPWTVPAGEESNPRWSPDGGKIAVVVDNAAIDAVDAAGKRARLVESENSILLAPSWRPDGSTVSYVEFDGSLPGRYGSAAARVIVGDKVLTEPAEDVFPFPAGWLSNSQIMYTADGHIRVRDLTAGTRRDIDFAVRASVRLPKPSTPVAIAGPDRQPVKGIVGPALAPSGDRIAFCALGDLWVTNMTGAAERLTRDAHLVCDPAWSPDGKLLAYCTDRSGNTDIWLRDNSNGSERQLTSLASAAVAPSWSPDGAKIAFQDQDGATFLVVVATGQATKVVDALRDPGRPTWSSDGSVLAFAAQKPASRRFREGSNQILTVNLTTRALAYHEVAPNRSISGRGFDGPVWSPDGSAMAFVMGAVLWVVPVDATGRPAGAPRQVTTEVADAPSWSGDSQTLCYLSLGSLRLMDVRKGVPRTVPLQLTWSPAQVRGRTVIQAGALWDGTADTLRREVDIVVDGDRIADVTSRRSWDHCAVVDAQGFTVMPGMTDMHAHVHLKGRFFGSRQGRLWLSFGVTSVRSPGDPAYLAAQQREAISDGSQLGPRYFGAGEPIDGRNVYYGFVRPTAGAREVAREVDRAKALGYDLIKTYVRLPAVAQEQIIRAAQVPVTSHYAYPAARFGLRGMEHLGATSKLGYSQTLSRVGRSYDDLVKLVGETGMSITPTMFVAAVLMAGDNSWLTDERVAKLYPAWELTALRNTVALVSSTLEVTQAMRQVLAANVDTVRRIAQAGGLVISGTDAPIDHIGISLHLNLRGLVANGMTAFDALRTATHNAAVTLGAQEQFGTVTRGKLADLVFVDGNPLADITRAAAVGKVMVGGVLHEVSDLIDFPDPGRSQAVAGHKLVAHQEFWWHGDHSAHACC